MATFELEFLAEAKSQLEELASDRQAKRLKAVRKALGYQQINRVILPYPQVRSSKGSKR